LEETGAISDARWTKGEKEEKKAGGIKGKLKKKSSEREISNLGNERSGSGFRKKRVETKGEKKHGALGLILNQLERIPTPSTQKLPKEKQKVSKRGEVVVRYHR